MSHDDKAETKRDAIKLALATLRGKYEVRGHKMDVDVALCCYDYGITPIRLSFKLDSGKAWGCVDGEDRITLLNATRADVQRILDSGLVDKTCERCKVAFVAEPKSNRRDKCETCWLEDFDKECKAMEEADRKALERQDRKMLAKGMAYRVSAWIHAGGDDKLVDYYYSVKPTAEEIQKSLRRARSRVVDDYTVVDLKTGKVCEK